MRHVSFASFTNPFYIEPIINKFPIESSKSNNWVFPDPERCNKNINWCFPDTLNAKIIPDFLFIKVFDENNVLLYV